MIRRLSTQLSSSCIPSIAFVRVSLLSPWKGSVTTATVRMPLFFAMDAITGVAPVPVPPPIPAVMNSISVSGVKIVFSIRSSASMAAFLPLIGLVPAPLPAPSWIFTGTLLLTSDCLSVLQTMNVQPSIFCSYMYVTALHPPPPTPTTLMRESVGTQSSGVIMSL